MGRRILDNPKMKRRVLEAIRKTGMIEMGWTAAGINETTLQRYRNDHPEFDNAVFEAIEYYKFRQELEYGTRVRNKALKLLEKKIDEETLNDNVMLKFLFEKDGRIGG